MSEELVKKSIGLHLQPLYKIPSTQESKEFECEFTDRTPIGDDVPIAPEYDNLYRCPIRRLKTSALDYSSITPFVQHQYGLGYDGNHSMNRSEFPRFAPWQRHNYYTKITDGDYNQTEYTEGNPDLLPKRDNGVKYRDTDYLSEEEETQHYRDHYMDQNTLELLGKTENIVKIAVLSTHIKPLINLVETINEKTTDFGLDEIFDYLLGGLAYIQANYKNFDNTEQKLYDTLIYNSMHEANMLNHQIHIYIEQNVFKNNPTKYLYKTLKEKYHNLYELIKTGRV
jgi:hypothetical protein